jgi:hypothetical protein
MRELPLLARRGGCGKKKKREASAKPQTGWWVMYKNKFWFLNLIYHPVCAFAFRLSARFRNLFSPAMTVPTARSLHSRHLSPADLRGSRPSLRIRFHRSCGLHQPCDICLSREDALRGSSRRLLEARGTRGSRLVRFIFEFPVQSEYSKIEGEIADCLSHFRFLPLSERTSIMRAKSYRLAARASP